MNENYQLPPLTLLDGDHYELNISDELKEKTNTQIKLILQLFENEKIILKPKTPEIGPTMIRYRFEIDYLNSKKKSVRYSDFEKLQKEVEGRLKTSNAMIEAPIPDSGDVGFTIERKDKDSVPFTEIIEDSLKINDLLGIALGKNIIGETQAFVLNKVPHLLVAGATQSGKSVGLNLIISTILMKARPDEVKLVLIDPKGTEFGIYSGIHHLLEPVVTDMDKAGVTLSNLVQEMDRRFELSTSWGNRLNTQITKLEKWNQLIDEGKITGEEKFPYIICIIDEFKDLYMTHGKDIESAVNRLAQKARSVGIHLILATQSPDSTSIPSSIRTNIPSRWIFKVATQTDSTTALGAGYKAQQLFGFGDSIYRGPSASHIGDVTVRLQGGFVSDREVSNIVDHIKGQSWTEPKREEPEEEPFDVWDQHETEDLEDLQEETNDNTDTEELNESAEEIDFGDITQEDHFVTETTLSPAPKSKSKVEDIDFNNLFTEETNDHLETKKTEGYSISLGFVDDIQQLTSQIAKDILTQIVTTWQVKPQTDELFVSVIGGHAYNLDLACYLVFDVKVAEANHKLRKRLIHEKPLNIIVPINIGYSTSGGVIINEVIDYFKEKENTSDLLVLDQTHLHGFLVKPYLPFNPQSKNFKGFIYNILKEPWLNHMVEDLEISFKKIPEGLYTVTQQESKAYIKNQELLINTNYTYTSKDTTGTVEVTRLFEKIPLNNQRYEDALNEIINEIVIGLNLKYNKGNVSLQRHQILFAGFKGIVKQWEKIVSGDNINVLYDRAKLMGLNPKQYRNQPIFTMDINGIIVLGSGNGFYVEHTNIGYIKQEHSLEQVLSKSKNHPQLYDLMKILTNLYDLRKRVGNMGAKN